MFNFDFQPKVEFDLFVTGRSHFLLSERSLSFNNVMITLKIVRGSACIVELTSGLALRKHVESLDKSRDVNKRSQSLAWYT